TNPLALLPEYQRLVELGRGVGLHASALGETEPVVRDDRALLREAFDVRGLLREERAGDDQRKEGVHVPGLLEARVEAVLDRFPDRVAVRPEDDAALDRRVV